MVEDFDARPTPELLRGWWLHLEGPYPILTAPRHYEVPAAAGTLLACFLCEREVVADRAEVARLAALPRTVRVVGICEWCVERAQEAEYESYAFDVGDYASEVRRRWWEAWS